MLTCRLLSQSVGHQRQRGSGAPRSCFTAQDARCAHSPRSASPRGDTDGIIWEVGRHPCASPRAEALPTIDVFLRRLVAVLWPRLDSDKISVAGGRNTGVWSVPPAYVQARNLPR